MAHRRTRQAEPAKYSAENQALALARVNDLIDRAIGIAQRSNNDRGARVLLQAAKLLAEIYGLATPTADDDARDQKQRSQWDWGDGN